MVYCPKCGKEVSDDVFYCPYCGAQIKVTIRKTTGYPIAGGILGIIASCLCIFMGIIGLIDSTYYYDEFVFFMSVFNLIGFAFGLTGGILTLRRKNFPMAIIGISLILTSSVITMSATFGSPFLIVFGLPISILSILSLIFTAISKSEFA
jgi:DNA-directed RNA polymerase subunit RPC12/RpoP